MQDHISHEVCYFCGNTSFEEKEVEQTYQINGKHYLVSSIPAHVCTNCGEPVFTLEVGERIRKILNAEVEALHHKVTIEQYEYAE